MADMRIGIIGLLHESNTFMDSTTTRQHFADASLDIGSDLIGRWSGTHHELGGFLDGARKFGFEPVPIFAAVAVPSGPLEPKTFHEFVADIVKGVKDAGDLDGILLALHGSTVALNEPDVDGAVVTQVRQQVGPDLPIVMTLDLHANVSSRMISGTTATVMYRTTPHVDQRDRGVDAAGIIARTVRGEIKPVQVLETLPMLMLVLKHDTNQEPAASNLRDTHAVIERPGIVSASIGYAYRQADVADMGTSVVAVADGDEQVARDAACWLARRVWDRRREFVGDLPSVEQGIREAAASTQVPVVISDVGDNVSGGAPGDSTILFDEIMRQGLSNALVVLFDPQAAAQCADVGVGSKVQLKVGAKTDNRHGRPVLLQGHVRTLSDGYFYEPQPRHGGRSDNYQGLTAVVETPEQHTVVLTSLRMAPMSLQQVVSLGIDPAQKKLIIVKATIAPRAAYRAVANQFVLVNTPGVTTMDLSAVTYRNRRCPMFPFEDDATYMPSN